MTESKPLLTAPSTLQDSILLASRQYEYRFHKPKIDGPGDEKASFFVFASAITPKTIENVVKNEIGGQKFKNVGAKSPIDCQLISWLMSMKYFSRAPR